MDRRTLASFLDLANHHPQATEKEIKDLCLAVKKYGFHSAFVNPFWVKKARELIGTEGAVGTVVAFPLGQETRDIKILSAIKAVDQGANELDISMNVGLFKQGSYKETLEEMEAIVNSVKEIKKSTVVKFIIETGLLTDAEIKKASELVLKSGADFVKTCSGWGPRGASLKDVELIKKAVGEKIKIKVAGGIDTLKEALDFLNFGVQRIGTSKAREIINELK